MFRLHRLTAIVNPAVEISVAVATAILIVLGGYRVINGFDHHWRSGRFCPLPPAFL